MAAGAKDAASAIYDKTTCERIAFWNSDMTRCVHCAQTNVLSRELVAGRRDNGDEYGTNEYMCRTPGCGWSTSFFWDDANKECLFSETEGWLQGIGHFPARWAAMWARQRHFPACVLELMLQRQTTGADLRRIGATVDGIVKEFGVGENAAILMKADILENEPDF